MQFDLSGLKLLLPRIESESVECFHSIVLARKQVLGFVDGPVGSNAKYVHKPVTVRNERANSGICVDRSSQKW